jgi:hypothetical protein
MIDCETMTDRMALVAHARASWSVEEEAHLAACAGCSAEWRIVQEAARLGTGVAERLDSDRMSRVVLAQLAAERRRRRWTRGLALLATAAAAAIIVWAGRPSRRGADTVASAGSEFHLPLAELEGLDAGQLQAVLEGFEAPLGGGSSPEGSGLGELKDYELERVLRSLEG